MFRIIFRLFEEKQLHTIALEQDRQDWLGTTCSHALRSVTDVLSQVLLPTIT